MYVCMYVCDKAQVSVIFFLKNFLLRLKKLASSKIKYYNFNYNK